MSLSWLFQPRGLLQTALKIVDILASRVGPGKLHSRSGLINGSEALKDKGLVSPHPIYETSSTVVAPKRGIREHRPATA
jgi:hypothetical protein